jgi:predicted nucleic acid-binding protein
MKNIFVDANIFIDIFNVERKYNKQSSLFYRYALKNKYKLFTSCDLITTIYYIDSKKDKKQALLNIQNINKTLKVIGFSNKEIEETCSLMVQNSDYKDLEDTIQYIMATKYKCDIIVSNDKSFVSEDIKLLTSEEFCNEYINDI